ncbi:MAG TPA: hypothetical protein VMK12_11615 [Anaeromyxobacteraceae bacterium]|nr:hypothetical protein [Anaeromyxobacteraceae bacterium]
MRGLNLLVAAFALLQCLRYGRRALLFFFPSVQVWGEPAAPPRSPLRLRLGVMLQALGFSPLGIKHERSTFGAFGSESDVYASERARAFVDVVENRAAGGPGVVFHTPFPDNAAVLTANFRRRALSTCHLQVGGMPGASLEAVLAAHRVAVDRFAARHGPPAVTLDLEARLSASRAFFARGGRRELRRESALPLAIALLGLLLLASSLNMFLRAIR